MKKLNTQGSTPEETHRTERAEGAGELAPDHLAPDNEVFRAAYRAMRYQGAAPVWRSQPTGAELTRSALLIPALAFVLLCVVGLWWLFSRGGSRVPDFVAEGVVVAEADTVGVVGGAEARTIADVTPERAEPEEFSRDLPVHLSPEQLSSNDGFAPEARSEAPPRPSPSGDSSAADHSGDTFGGFGAFEKIPKDVVEGLDRLRQEVRSLERSGASLPVAVPTMRFRIPRAPADHLSPGRPPVRSEVWSDREGAARD